MTVLVSDSTQPAEAEPARERHDSAFPSAERRVHPETYVWGIVLCGAFGYGAWRHRWLHEDGLINFRVVEQLLLGNGPVFNAGERVEAFTSPAQIALLAIGRLLTLGTVPIETVAFTVGIAAAVGGLWCAVLGATRLWGAPPTGSLRWLPLGAVVFVAIPATWDYATSGHEGALAYLWLGASLLVLSTRLERLGEGEVVRIDRARWALVLLGSGVLVRPEYALYSLSFLVCWWVLHRDAPGSRLRALAWAFSLVLLTEFLRMGYFGLLLPNTAAAKVSGTDWDRGARFLVSFVRPYVLQVALAVTVFIVAPVIAKASKPQRWVVGAFLVPSVLVVVQLALIGGDYMHGRLLVQPLFAVLAPIAVVPRGLIWNSGTQAARVRRGAFVLLCGWAMVAAVSLRADGRIRSTNILDPRLDSRQLAMTWTHSSARRVTDYRDSFLVGPYHPFLLTKDRSKDSLLFVQDNWVNQAVPLPASHPDTIATGAVGALGMIAGPQVHVIDRTALADLVAARQPIVQRSPGHMRYMPTPWVYARAGVGIDPASKAALRALSCGQLGELMASANDPLTPGRFVKNLLEAPRNSRVHVPFDPEEAVDEFC